MQTAVQVEEELELYENTLRTEQDRFQAEFAKQLEIVLGE